MSKSNKIPSVVCSLRVKRIYLFMLCRMKRQVLSLFRKDPKDKEQISRRLSRLCLSAIPAFLSLTFISGCQSPQTKYSEFIKTVTFSELDTYLYKETAFSGLEWRDADRLMLEQLSAAVIGKELNERGFCATASEADFQIVTRWHKSVSISKAHMGPVNVPGHTLHDYGNRSGYVICATLTVELTEIASGNVFWRKELRPTFEILQLSEKRVTLALEKAMQNFPERIIKDPLLPSIY